MNFNISPFHCYEQLTREFYDKWEIEAVKVV